MRALAIHPLTPDRWNDFASLMETDSICRMCWCVAFRLPPSVRHEMKSDLRKKHMSKVVKAGPPPGLLAYRHGEAVGWVAIAPRPATPEFNTGRKSSAVENESDATDDGVWAATCFFIRKDARGLGVTTELVDAAEAWAKKNGARRLEACPMAHDEKRSTAGLFVGPKRVFDRAGYVTILERKAGRPLMRKELKVVAAKKPAPKKKAPAKKAATKKVRGK